MKVQNVGKTTDISLVSDNSFVFCKELNKGLIKKDFEALNANEFKDVCDAIEALPFDALEAAGYDSVTFGKGQIQGSFKKDSFIKKCVLDMNERNEGSRIQEFLEKQFKFSKFFDMESIDLDAGTLDITPIKEISNETTPEFTIKTENDIQRVEVSIKNSKGKIVQTIQAKKSVFSMMGSGSTWSAKANELPSGEYTSEAIAFDKMKNKVVIQIPSFTIDTDAGEIKVVPITELSNDTTPQFIISADDDTKKAIIKIKNSKNKVVQEINATKIENKWVAVSPELESGDYTAEAVSFDNVGNESSITLPTFTVDTDAGTVVVDAIASISNIKTPQFSIVAPEDAKEVKVTIFDVNGNEVKTLNASKAMDKWIAVSPELPSGDYTAKAVSIDKVGNESKYEIPKFTIDTDAGTVEAESISEISNNNTPKFNVTAPKDAKEVSVTIFQKITNAYGIDTKELIQVIEATKVEDKWIAVSPELPSGDYTAEVTSIDKAGNTTNSSLPEFTIDTDAGTLFVEPITALSNNANPEFKITAPEDTKNVTVTIADSMGKTVQSLVAVKGDLAWLAKAQDLESGIYNVEAKSIDKVGNETVIKLPSFTIDTEAGVLNIEPIDALSNNTKPQFNIKAPIDTDEVKIEIINSNGVTVQTLNTLKSESGWVAVAQPLVSGDYTAKALFKDKAGNTGETTLPPFTIDAEVSEVSNIVYNIGDDSVTITMTGNDDISEITVTIKNSSDEVVFEKTVANSNNSFEVVTPKLDGDTYKVIVESKDRVGNTNTTESEFEVKKEYKFLKLLASDGADHDYFGYSVAVSDSKIVVGAYNDDDKGDKSGSVYIYDLDGTNEKKITASDGFGSDYFGYSVAVSDSKIVVGAYLDDDKGVNSGSVYVYDLDGTNEKKITASDGADSDYFGKYVAVSDSKIVVGAYQDDDKGVNSGSVYVYDLDQFND